MNERGSIVRIGGKEYEMLLTTRATKDIAKRYGGIGNLGDKLLNNENFEDALNEIIYLITLLCNQSILIHNLENPTDNKELLKEEDVELLTSPYDLGNFKDAILEALYKGAKREVEGEDIAPSKNTQVE